MDFELNWTKYQFSSIFTNSSLTIQSRFWCQKSKLYGFIPLNITKYDCNVIKCWKICELEIFKNNGQSLGKPEIWEKLVPFSNKALNKQNQGKKQNW